LTRVLPFPAVYPIPEDGAELASGKSRNGIAIGGGPPGRDAPEG